jgi:hypothetical protein
MHKRMFFGCEARYDTLAVVAVDATGTPLLRARFPLARDAATTLAEAAEVRTALAAFVAAHAAAPVWGIDHAPPLLTTLARELGGPVCLLGAPELERTAPPGYDGPLGRAFGVDAHLRALIAALSVAGAPEAT